MNIGINRLSPDDIGQFKQLILVFETVFEMQHFVMPEESHLQKLLDDPGFYAIVANVNGAVLGGLTAYTMQQYYTALPLVYIFDLAVKTAFQRQGVGKKLMEGIIRHCKMAGVEEIMVQADEEDVHALEFYHATGGIPEKVVHFNYPLIGPQSK